MKREKQSQSVDGRMEFIFSQYVSISHMTDTPITAIGAGRGSCKITLQQSEQVNKLDKVY